MGRVVRRDEVRGEREGELHVVVAAEEVGLAAERQRNCMAAGMLAENACEFDCIRSELVRGNSDLRQAAIKLTVRHAAYDMWCAKFGSVGRSRRLG